MHFPLLSSWGYQQWVLIAEISQELVKPETG